MGLREKFREKSFRLVAEVRVRVEKKDLESERKDR